MSPSQRSSPKIVRWTDLIASLLRYHRAIPFETIAREVPGYGAESKGLATVKRMFERDKKELLRFGVPIETAPDDDGEPTLYTINRKSFYLPYLGVLSSSGRRATEPRHGKVGHWTYRALQSLAFEPDELAAVADAAVRVRQLGDPSLAADAESAMRKLAFDLPVDAVAARDEPRVVPPRPQPDAAAFDTLGDALRDRKVVSFDYHAIGSDATARRAVEPYGLFYLNGHWYLAGRDRERAAVRNFRLSRMSGVVPNKAKESTPDYDIPADFRLREHAGSRHAWELGDGDACEAVVEFARDTGATVAAARLGAPVADHPTRRCFQVRRTDAFARWLLSFGDDARPVSPESLLADYGALVRSTAGVYADSGPASSA